MFTANDIVQLGEGILDCQPNAIICCRILRDVLCLPPDSPEREAAHTRLLSHPWVMELAHAQRLDGSWGRFHSMDSALKARFPTSEIAIRRALALGLEKGDPVLAGAIGFMERVLYGDAVWSDRAEESEGWQVIVEAITAATLAEVDPAHPSLRSAWEYWVEVAQRSFPVGRYAPAAEWKAHRDLRGCGVYYLDSRYVLTLLGARSADLPPALDRRLVDWIWRNAAGIAYLGADMKCPRPFHIFNWLESLEILSRFQCWREVAEGAVEWLWNQRSADGLWDFGSKVSKSFYYPLSDGWRKAGNRSVDHTTRVLVLLSGAVY